MCNLFVGCVLTVDEYFVIFSYFTAYTADVVIVNESNRLQVFVLGCGLCDRSSEEAFLTSITEDQPSWRCLTALIWMQNTWFYFGQSGPWTELGGVESPDGKKITLSYVFTMCNWRSTCLEHCVAFRPAIKDVMILFLIGNWSKCALFLFFCEQFVINWLVV